MRLHHFEEKQAVNNDGPSGAAVISCVVSKTQGKPVIIFVPELGVEMGNRLYDAAVQNAFSNGFSTIRYNLSGEAPGNRKLEDLDVAVLTADFGAVIGFARHLYGEVPIAVVGHGVGALPVMLAKSELLSFAVLWDPIHQKDLQFGKNTSDAATKFSYDNGANDVVVSGAFVDSCLSLDCDALVEQFEPPIKIIASGTNPFPKSGNRYFKVSGGRFGNDGGHRDVADAEHFFEGCERQLFYPTIAWLAELQPKKIRVERSNDYLTVRFQE